jgi:hypothetical protein
MAEKINRVGETITNVQGLKMLCVEYTNNKNMVALVEATGQQIKCRYSNFKHGLVKANLEAYPVRQDYDSSDIEDLHSGNEANALDWRGGCLVPAFAVIAVITLIGGLYLWVWG